MKVIKRLMAKDGGTYQKDGQTKNSYMQCGVVMIDEATGERSYKIKGYPINFDGWLNEWDLPGENIANNAGLNQPQQMQQQAPQQNYQQQGYQQAPQGGYNPNNG